MERARWRLVLTLMMRLLRILSVCLRLRYVHLVYFVHLRFFEVIDPSESDPYTTSLQIFFSSPLCRGRLAYQRKSPPPSTGRSRQRVSSPPANPAHQALRNELGVIAEAKRIRMFLPSRSPKVVASSISSTDSSSHHPRREVSRQRWPKPQWAKAFVMATLPLPRPPILSPATLLSLVCPS